MDEFKGFKFSKVEDLKKDLNAEIGVFKSELGPYNYNQDRLLRFSHSKYMGIFILILSISFLFTSLSSLNILLSTSIEWSVEFSSRQYLLARAVSVITILIVLVLLVGFVLMYVSGRKTNPKGILLSLDAFSLFISILYIIFVIVLMVCCVIIFTLLLKPFIITFLILIVMLGLLYCTYLFLSEMLQFSKSLREIFEPSIVKQNPSNPTVYNLKEYFKICFIIVFIGFGINMFSIEQIPTFIGPLSFIVDSLAYNILHMIVSLSAFVLFIVLLEKFEEEFKFSNQYMPKEKAKETRSYEGFEEVK